MPYNRALNGVVTFVNDVTNPYLNVFRRILPPVGGGGFAIDLSPIIGVFVLLIVQGLVVGAIRP
jgi:YggT family protein